MLYRPENVPMLMKVKEKTLSIAFAAIVLVAMAGWIYLLGWLFLKFLSWCFS